MGDAHTLPAGRRPFTVVSFHAHPDDEVLLTGGTLARLAAEGNRVVVVTATAGERGLAGEPAGLGATRRQELFAAASALGVHRSEILGYGDSGMAPAPLPPDAFCAVPEATVARQVADLLAEERADLLIGYDPAGGYGHRDHVHVHRVGRAAAQLAGTLIAEATINRDRLARGVRLLRRLRIPVDGLDPDRLAHAFLGADEITHALDVRPYLDRKIAAMRAHASQTTGGAGVRTLSLLLRLPKPVRRVVLGTEWFREVGRTPPPVPLTDLLDSLRR